MEFTEFSFHPAVVEGLDKFGFKECTPIQELSIPHILAGRDVAGLAQTGTGKTAAFVLPLMDRILRSKESIDATGKPIFKDWRDSNYILILVPTRELAEQVYENVQKFGGPGKMNAAVIYGGTSYDAQKKAISEGVDFVIATPGRLIDLFKEKVVDLNQVRAVVFDEADRMFDMGFKDDMKYILQRIPRDRQFLVYSATLNFDVLNTAYEFGADPVEVNVSKDQAQAENVTDSIFHVGHNEKPKFLISLIKKHNPRQVIIFSNFKRNVERISKFLSSNGIPAMGISSLLTQAQRNRVMSQFREENDQNILVATDVAARGLDVKGVDMVFNYEMPDDPENYVHRIGRTGRAGEKGVAFGLVSDRDVEALSRIESYVKHKVEIGWLDDSEMLKDFKEFPRDTAPRDRGRDGRPSGRRDTGRSGSGSRERAPRRDAKDSRGTDRNRSRTRDRDKDRDKDREKRPVRSASVDGADKKPQHQHRDRASGRHRGKKDDNRKREDRTKEGSLNRNVKRTDGKSDAKSADYRKRNSKAGPKRGHSKRFDASQRKPQKPASVGQKISGFFKKLFD